MRQSDPDRVHPTMDANSVIRWLIVAIEYAIVASLMLVASIVYFQFLIH